ncbi:hypothetical protein JOQ06_012390, partial [Pogonophryne albipinna]
VQRETRRGFVPPGGPTLENMVHLREAFMWVGCGKVMDPLFTHKPGGKRTINIPLSASSANA